MIFVLSGFSNINKGAELMFDAVVQEIEQYAPNSTVYLPVAAFRGRVPNNSNTLTFKYKPIEKFIRIIRKFHLNGILRKLHLPEILDDIYAIKNADYFIDGSGLVFSDVQRLDSHLYRWEHLLRNQKKQNTKIIFLPQMFGPCEKEATKATFKILNKYADLIFAREKASFSYIKDSGLIDMQKVFLCTDFTPLVHGVVPPEYKHLENAVCLIPNNRMYGTRKISKETYFAFLKAIIRHLQEIGKGVYLLNHEGEKDDVICQQIRSELNNGIEVVTGLDAIQTKGLISSAGLVISSRFHGVASSLNTGVPCLATSWSHKYSELFHDFGITDGVLSPEDIEACIQKIDSLLEPENNQKVRKQLAERLPDINKSIHHMWEQIWKI